MRRIFLISLGMMGASLLLQCEAFEAYPSLLCQGAECLAFIEAGACDQSLAPSVPEASVVYVSPTGTASGTGSKDSPVNSIHAALTMLRDGKTNLFVCKGTYNENVVLAGVSNVSLYGGFSCNDWMYTCEKPAVAPLTGYALEVDGISSVSLTDMHFEAQKRVSNGESSIAAFVNKSSGVTFTRVELVANAAAKGNDGSVGADGEWATTTGEKNASTITPGQGVSCTCTTGGGVTAGGNGGDPGGPGDPGTPNLDENPKGQTPPQDGAPGIGGASCVPNGSGHNGADAPAGSNGDAITVLGKLTVSGWAPSNGNSGTSGNPGQGGGGGGGNNGAGGGGGCGGCGGAGGAGGTAGGSSIALLSFDSSVQLVSCDLSTGQAGNGGAGGNGGGGMVGSGGGLGGAGANNGCSGGNGGQGGAGGAGSGGAGGISAGILYSGTAPTLDTETAIHPGAAGTHGGAGISGKPSLMEGNPGHDGLSGKMVSTDDWTLQP